MKIECERSRIENIIYVAFVSVCVISLALFIFFSIKSKSDNSFESDRFNDWSKEWYVRDSSGREVRTSLPVKVDIPPGKFLIARKTLPERINRDNCLMVAGIRQDVYAYVDGIERLKFSDEDTRFVGRTTPSGRVLIPIYVTDANKDIVLKIRSDSAVTGLLQRVYLGSEQSIVLDLFKKHFAEAFITALIVIIGIGCIVGDTILRVAAHKTTPLIYLFWVSTLLAVWFISQSEIRQILVRDISLFENVGYIAFMLFPIALFLCMNHIQSGRYSKIYCTLCVLTFVQFVVHMAVIAIFNTDLYFMQLYIQLAVIGLIGVSIYTCKLDFDKGMADEVRFPMIGLGIFAVGILVEAVSMMYVIRADVGIYVILGLFLFLVLNVFSVSFEISRQERERQSAINASNAKSQFLATMSHEIRTPINAVLGMNELILRDSKDKDILGYASNISNAGRSLLSLVNDILDFSKIESGKMDIIEVEYSFKNLLSDLINMAKARLIDKHIELKTDIDESIPARYYGDDIRIKQIVTNLLTNAIKYTEKGTILLTVRASLIGENQADIYCSVKDTGKGISEENLEKLNSAFVRVDEKNNRNIEGTGLGLSIVRNLLRLMDSELKIESKVGEGSNFYFTLRQTVIDASPMGAISDVQVIEKKEEEQYFTAPKARILVVDDNQMNLTVVQGLLSPSQIQIDTADSGVKSINLAKHIHYDIILMDHMMPEMDGIEAFHHIREDLEGESQDSPVIALTANAISGAADQYAAEGFEGYVTKPIMLEELNRTLLKFIPEEYVTWHDRSELAENEALDDKGKYLFTANINGALAEQYCAGDMNSYIEILKSYLKSGKKSLEAVADKPGILFDEEDIKGFTIKVHALKSSSLTIGARILSEMALALENAGHNGDEAFIKENQSACRDLYEVVVSEVSQYLVEGGFIKEAAPKTDSEPLDGEDAGGISSALLEKLTAIREALDDFEYDEAMEMLDGIIGG